MGFVELKEEGNKLFKEGKHKEAAVKYTLALKEKPDTVEYATILSNRSAAFFQIGRFKQALTDAEECIQLRGDWSKGWWRKSRALEELKRKDEAIQALLQGLTLEPTNTEMQKALKKLDPSAVLPSPPKKEIPKVQEPSTQSSDTNDSEMGEDVVKFAQGIIGELREGFSSKVGSGIEKMIYRAHAYLLPEDSSQEQAVIAIDKAFLSPDTNIECTYFLRDLIIKEKMKAAMIVAQKSSVSYPQRWKGKTSKEWNFDESQDGLFLQLETKDSPSGIVRLVHFLPIGTQNELSLKPYILDVDNWSLLPPLFRDTPFQNTEQ